MPYEKFAIITLTFKWHTGEKSLETFGKQIENCLHQNSTYCYFQKQRNKYKMKLYLKTAYQYIRILHYSVVFFILFKNKEST